MGKEINRHARGMAERRQRILQAAAELIGEVGLDGLTTRQLAERAGVTTPTLYNLIGNKDEIIRQMFEADVETVWTLLEFGDADSTLEMVDRIVGSVVELVTTDEKAHKELVLATDHLAGFYAPAGDLGMPESEASKRSIEMSVEVARRAVARGEISDLIAPEILARQIFISYRGPFRDWAHGLISLGEMQKRQFMGFYINLASVANEDFRAELHGRLAKLMAGEKG